MSNSIRTTISLPKDLFLKVKKYNLSMSKICQEALEVRIKKEDKNHQRNLSINKLKKIYYNKGFETGGLSSKNMSKYELKISLSTLKGEGRYDIWTLVDRVDDVFERNFDYKIFDDHFYTYDHGWVLKDNTILKNPEYSWFTTDKPVHSAIEESRSETFFEYKYGFVMGLCNIQEQFEPIKANPTISKTKVSINKNKLTKKQAIEIVREEINISLNNRNTIYSNQNIANDQWWFEPKYGKLELTFFLLLNDKKDRMLFLFKIPAKKYRKASFRDRPEKGCVSIGIEGNDRFNFMDINSGSSNVKFSKHLIKTIKY